MKVLFMGTPDFAVESLRVLYEAGHEIVGVVTVPDKPMGRGLQLLPSPVKQFATEKGLLVLQPERLRDANFVEQIKDLQPDVAVVVAFRMLPEIVWRIPRLGTLNLHASLLPNFRGAAPINWAIIKGETRTGITTFFIDKEIDTGNLLLQKEIEILPEWNVGNLYEILMREGAKLVLETLTALSSGNLVPQPQVEKGQLHAAPKILKEDCKINWQQKVVEVHNFIRGMSPHPAAFTLIAGKLVKIFKTSLPETSIADDTEVGKIHVNRPKGEMQIKCLDGYLTILELQMEGKKRLHIGDFLRGQQEIWERVD